MRPGRRPLTAALQRLQFGKLDNWTATLSHGRLKAQGTVQPGELSRVYEVEIEYQVEKRPRIWVRKPSLDDIDGAEEPRPHTFPDGSLCLYHGRQGDWSPADPIVDYIVPWISEWLMYYEIWVATGVWEGGGEHPSSKPTASKQRVPSSPRRRKRRSR